MTQRHTPNAFQEKVKRLSDTVSLQASEIKMLRRKVGCLREELDQYRDKSPSKAVTEYNERCLS